MSNANTSASTVSIPRGNTEIETPLSGEAFGALINLSGRRRFTSQRIVLYAVLASYGDGAALATAREALGLFIGAHSGLVNGDGKMPGIFCDELRQAYFGALAGDRKISHFADLAGRALAAIERGSLDASELLAQLVRVTTPMLGVLNQITTIYEEQSKRHALLMKKQLRGVITEIETIAKQARMVAFNARIVAARAGPAGKEFAVVAGVLSSITGEIDDMVKAALVAA